MKLIDLLNKIANGEIKEGTKIKVPFLNEKFYEYVYLNSDVLWVKHKHKGGESIFTFKCSELNKGVEIIEEKPQGRWKPSAEFYWYINNHGEIHGCVWLEDKADNWRYLTKNIFKTKQEAEEYLEYKTALLEAEKPFELCKDNFFLKYDIEQEEVSVDSVSCIFIQGAIYLGTDINVAQAFIDKWKKQILKYEFGIEE